MKTNHVLDSFAATSAFLAGAESRVAQQEQWPPAPIGSCKTTWGKKGVIHGVADLSLA